jgi:outer membrane protein assembly factor BamB
VAISDERLKRALPWALAIVVAGAVVWYELPGSNRPSVEQSAIPEKWQFKASARITGALALADDGTLYAASEDGFVYALDPSGKLQWKFEAGPMAGGPALGADGTIYVSNEKQQTYAIDRSGTQQWMTGGGPYADQNTGNTAAAIDSNYLYSFWRGSLQAIRLQDGSAEWSAGVGFKNFASVTILPNRLVVYPGVGRVEAVGSEGKTTWEYPAPNPPTTVATLLANGGHPRSGNFWLESGMAVATDGTMYAGAGNARMVVLSSDGAYLWEFKTKPGSINRATPVIAEDGTIYFASGDGSLYALNTDGTQKWALDTRAASIATPMLAADGTIYVANGGWLIAASPDGKILAQVPLDAAAESSPTLAPDGTIYVASLAGTITAFAGTHGQLMNSPWPKFQRDLANSGRAPSW